jgi:hypothetical protein
LFSISLQSCRVNSEYVFGTAGTGPLQIFPTSDAMFVASNGTFNAHSS